MYVYIFYSTNRCVNQMPVDENFKSIVSVVDDVIFFHTLFYLGQ